MSDPVNRFLGDTPGRTIVKLAVISLVVGIIMAALNFTPMDVWYHFVDFVERLYHLGFRAFERFGEYLIYGAMVVLPVFLVVRLLNLRR